MGLPKLLIYIPENDHGIPFGNYTMNEIVALLRKHSQQASVIRFIADMLEE